MVFCLCVSADLRLGNTTKRVDRYCPSHVGVELAVVIQGVGGVRRYCERHDVSTCSNSRRVLIAVGTGTNLEGVGGRNGREVEVVRESLVECDCPLL